jgi:diguanylate cyclase (GGDEF)-like protein
VYYIVALSVIGLMTIFSHALIAKLLGTNHGFAYLINESGKQRMLSQRLTSMALQYYENISPLALKNMQQAFNQLQTKHHELSQPFFSKRDLTSEYAMKMHRLYFDKRDSIQLDIDRLAEEIKAFSQKRLSKNQQKKIIKKIVNITNVDLLHKLNMAVNEYQKESERRIDVLATIQWYLLIIVLCALFLEARYIFRPIFKRLHIAASRLYYLASKDELSDLYNRRIFNEKFKEQLILAKEFGMNSALMLIDIDHFKEVNDQHGHNAGDYIIHEVAQQIINNTRSTDLCFRYGGEEFAVLQPDVNKELTEATAKRLKEIIGQTEFQYEGEHITITVSIGVTMITKLSDAKTVGIADDALYQAKLQGRNRVVIH